MRDASQSSASQENCNQQMVQQNQQSSNPYAQPIRKNSTSNVSYIFLLLNITIILVAR